MERKNFQRMFFFTWTMLKSSSSWVSCHEQWWKAFMMMMKVASDTSLPSAAFPNTTLLQLTFANGAGPFSSHLDHDANRDNNRDDHGKGRKSVSTKI